jgi:hypothetical protein
MYTDTMALILHLTSSAEPFKHRVASEAHSLANIAEDIYTRV